jgi:hypothetical protein
LEGLAPAPPKIPLSEEEERRQHIGWVGGLRIAKVAVEELNVGG